MAVEFNRLRPRANPGLNDADRRVALWADAEVGVPLRKTKLLWFRGLCRLSGFVL